MTAGHIGNRHPGLSGFQNHRHFLLCGIAPAALDSAEDFDSISIRRHSRMTRRTPSSYLSNYVRLKWGLLHILIFVHYGVRTWRWVRAFRILRPPITTTDSQIRAIAARNHTWSEPNRFSAGCITNIPSRRHMLDWLFANYSLTIRPSHRNQMCERIVALSVRRECLDWLIPLSESHLRSILRSWIAHYNAGRPHMALGPGVPDPPPSYYDYRQPNSRHRREESYVVRAKSILGGLHHEYSLAPTHV